MKRDLSRFWPSFGTVAVLALAGTATVGSHPALAQAGSHSCHLLTSAQSIPEGFGAAYNVLSADKELLLDVECGSSSNATLTVGNGQNTMYVYRFGYEWVNGGWKQIALQGERVAAKDWYVGTAKVNLTRSQAQLAEDNIVVAYTCLWHNSSWKCGCRDTNCSQNYWQLQAFRQQPPSGGGTGEPGIAAQFPRDQGIENHPAVLFHEDFESGSLQAWNDKWDRDVQYVFSTSNVHAGSRSLEGAIQKKSGEAGGHIGKRFSRGYNRLYMRWYVKYDPGWDTGPRKGSHVGGSMRACNGPCDPAGVQANGTNKFHVSFEPIQNSDRQIVFPPPGRFEFYVYHMDAPGSFGQIIRPDVAKSPAAIVGTNKWYAIEVMMKNNTVGKADGEIKGWVDGVLVLHKTGMRFRSINALVLDTIRLGSYIHDNPARTNRMWWDDVVVATEYVGPMAP